jgi:hypothetical protein
MNRAWIPAGALAGVSVAGLLALGPLTDSLGTPVKFETSVPVMTSPGKLGTGTGSVPVSVNVKVVGKTHTAAAVSRGGKSTASASNTDSGFVSVKQRTVTARPATSSTPVVADAPAKPPATTKKPAKRPVSIGNTGETNSDSGFAGGDGSSSTGEQSVTPGT